MPFKNRNILHLLFFFLVLISLQNVYAISTGTGAEELPLGSDAGDDLNVGGGKLVVEGDTGNVGIGDASPDAKLDVEIGDVRVGTGTFDNASGVSDVYVTGNLEVDGAIFATIPLTGISDINTATAGSGRILVNNGTKFNSVALGGDVSVDSFGLATIADNSVDGTDIAVGSDAQGDILYYDGTDWTRLGAGTSGHFLKTQGAGANPTWAAASGGASSLTGLSDVNSSTQGAGRILVSDGSDFQSTTVSGDVTITSGGVTDLGAGVVGANEIASSGVTAATYDAATITVDADGRITAAASSSLTGLSDVNTATAGSGRILVNNGTKFNSVALGGDVSVDSFGSATIADNSVDGTDIAVGSDAQGDILYYDGTDWTRLAAGTSGYFLKTQGAGANPTWAASSGGASSLTGLSDVNSATQGVGRLLVSDGNKFNSVSLLTVDYTTGNVGISNTSPTAKLDVNGTISSGGSGDSYFLGNVGIGDSTPTETLDVAGTIQTTGFKLTTGATNGYVLTSSATGVGTWQASSGGASSLTGLSDVNSATQEAGRILVSDGSDFQSTTVSGDITITSGGVTDLGAGVVGANEIASSGVTAATYNAATLTVDADGRITAAASSSLTGLSDVNTATAGSGRILVNNGTKFNSVALGGDVSVDSFGSATIADNSVDGTDIAIGSDAQGDILYYDGTDWTRLAAGTSGHFLKTQGAGANPTWAAASGSGATSLTGLSDVNSATQATGRILISDGNKFNSEARIFPAVVTLTDGANIATDASKGNHFRVTLGGNRTLDAPTNGIDGQKIIYEVIQDGTGGRTLNTSAFYFGTDIASVTLTTTASKRDFIGCVYNASTDRWYIIAFVKGY